MSVLWTSDDLIAATGGMVTEPFCASGLSIDTRTIARGDIFIALQGENGDGHAFVAEALAKGASGAMVHRPISGISPLLQVDDTLAALARLGGFARARFGGELAAITGSVGKTTTKEMLRAVLSAHGKTHAAVASYNNHWGLPLTLARTPADARFCIAEIGMNHAGEIAPLARLAQPNVAVITAVEKAHIGYLGSIEAIADEKAAIMQGLVSGGTAVLPADSPLISRLRNAVPHGARIHCFGETESADARLIELHPDAEGSTVIAQIGGEPVRFRLNAPGRHMAMNALAALTAAAALDIPAPRAARSLETFSPVSGRGARRILPVPGGTVLLLDESYNGNSASIRAALSVLRLQPARRRIAVLGDMLELGDEAPAEHAGLTPAVAASADLVFTCGNLMRHLFESVPEPLRGSHAPDSAALAPLVAAALAPGDAVLVKGSLGSRMKLIVSALQARAEAA
jgi:UDP-N-acetylmuramoyl-tripeptide--D-alanyl-D-alanine ligase